MTASPDDTHQDLVMACLDAVKQLLCETPLATTASECRRIVDREVAGGRRPTQLGYIRRFDRGYSPRRTHALDALSSTASPTSHY